MQLVLGSSRGTPIQSVTALLTHQHSLQQRGPDGASRCKVFVFRQLLLCHCEQLLTHQRRNRNFDPILARPLMVGAIPTRQSFSLAYRSRDSLSRPQLIHDELGQALTAIKLEFTSLLQNLPSEEELVGRRSQAILKLLNQTSNPFEESEQNYDQQCWTTWVWWPR